MGGNPLCHSARNTDINPREPDRSSYPTELDLVELELIPELGRAASIWPDAAASIEPDPAAPIELNAGPRQSTVMRVAAVVPLTSEMGFPTPMAS
jgi:hypothetical protein